MEVEVELLAARTDKELMTLAQEAGISNYRKLSRQDLLMKLLRVHIEQRGGIFCAGILEIMPDGYGFLRQETLLPSSNDIYVSQSQIRRFGLRTGDFVLGEGRTAKAGEKYYGLMRVEMVNGMDSEAALNRPHFSSLVPVYPDKLLDLETDPSNLTTRLINLAAPIGRGQRGLIVSPPKAGKTTVLKAIANAITSRYRDVHLMVCLIGERPEEVTDMKRSVQGEVLYATFDEVVENQVRVAELGLERAKRMVEMGASVVMLVDGITRLTRAYNLAMPSSGRTLSGGVDPVALYPPKKFFGAARNIDDGGSLTMLATCLVDTGSRMDDLIYEEFKGTGNMELHLDRRLAERQIFPAIDLTRSGTRRDELLFDAETIEKVRLFKRMVAMINADSSNYAESIERVIERLSRTKNNAEFLANLARGGM